MPSSVIAGFNYHPLDKVLCVTFVSGLVYNYLNVPEQVFRALKASFSKVTFLNQEIRGKYEFERVMPQPGGVKASPEF